MHSKRSIILSFIACGITAGALIFLMCMAPEIVKRYGETRNIILICFYPCALLGLCALAILAKLLNNIRCDNPFCRQNVLLLRIIALLCFMASAIFLAGSIYYLPYLFLCGGTLFIALILNVVKNVMQKAVEIREENDLTV